MNSKNDTAPNKNPAPEHLHHLEPFSTIDAQLPLQALEMALDYVPPYEFEL